MSVPLDSAPTDPGLTAVAGLEVGHAVMEGRPTGCTVVLARGGAVGGVDVRGGAPGTRETDLLDPVNSVQVVHAVVLSGGSAFGLDAASGVVRYLEERGIGYATSGGPVPIVPAAILYDLGVGGDASIRPDAGCGARAAVAAGPGPVAQGSVGAGAGATVGKIRGAALAMKGGLGSVSLRLGKKGEGPVVAALAAVNAVGDVIDPDTGAVVAGVRTASGEGLADARKLVRQERLEVPLTPTNTTLVVVGTDARLTKAQATKIAQMAQDGLARSLYPSHTPWDGDTVFVLATGRRDEAADVTRLGAAAADAVARAVVRAVLEAEGLPGLPAARDLAGGPPPPEP